MRDSTSMNQRLVRPAVVAAISVLVVYAAASARPNRYGHSDREERHMFPAVSSGPLDPAWSPDGKWIAFSMRGDIWKVPAEGGEAIALTSGPNYYFEPAWSPDGTTHRVLAWMSAATSRSGSSMRTAGRSRRVASQPARRLPANVVAATERASTSRARASGGWRIFRHDFATNADTAIINGIQPSVSPDGKSLAYEQGGAARARSGDLRITRRARRKRPNTE